MINPILKQVKISIMAALLAVFVMLNEQLSTINFYLIFSSLFFCIYNAISKFFIYLEITLNKTGWESNAGVQPALFNVDVIYQKGNVHKKACSRDLNWSLHTKNPIIKYRVTAKK